MKRKLILPALLLIAAMAAGCGDEKLDVFATMQVDEAKVPQYTVASESATSTDLIGPSGSARAAIADYADQNLDSWGDEIRMVQTVDSADAAAVTCRLEYVGSEVAAANRTDLKPSDNYPALYLTNCDG